MVQEQKHIIKRYSLAFKKQVVKEYEAGHSASSLRNRYGIGSTHMVVKWVNKGGAGEEPAHCQQFAAAAPISA